MEESLTQLADALAAEFGPALPDRSVAFGELTVTATAADIVRVMRSALNRDTG